MDDIITPNLDRLAEVKSVVEEIEWFISFLKSKGIVLANYKPAATYPSGDVSRQKHLFPYDEAVLALIYDYMGIDESELDSERKKIVEHYMAKYS